MMTPRKGGLAETLFSLAAKLPWWAGALMALLSYMVLHQFAITEPTVTPTPGRMGRMASEVMLKQFAFIAQYVVPLFLLLGAAASAIRNRRQQQGGNDAANTPSSRAGRRPR